MRNKFIKDFALVILAYYLALFLINRLIVTVLNGMLSHDPIVPAVALPIAFVLSYAGIWLFFNKWKARFWIKACLVAGVIVVSYMLGLLIDMNTAYNMSHR